MIEKKRCTSCKKVVSLDNFYKNKSQSDGLSTYCKDCSHTRILSYYKENKQYFIKRGKLDKKKRQAKHAKFKDTLRCEICGENRWYCLDFHHVDSSKKDKEISVLVGRGASDKKIQEEIKKCIVLCVNCHREVHYKLRNDLWGMLD